MEMANTMHSWKLWVYHKLNKRLPDLVDYVVTIPPGGDTSALVETVITWKAHKKFKTRGLDPDQTASAIKATVKMLNIIEYWFNSVLNLVSLISAIFSKPNLFDKKN